LDELYRLASAYDAVLVVDEAHATGVLGPQGKGLANELPARNLITVHTCGKAVGVAGGIICASADIIDFLINKARPFIYATAPMPLQAHLVQKSLEILSGPTGDQKRQDLQQLVSCIAEQPFFMRRLRSPASHIVPVILGEAQRAVDVSKKLQRYGFDIRAIRPPTVPHGTSRLRLSLNVGLSQKILRDFVENLENLVPRDAA
jgi:8-amino-7-oxononanoate synthase